MIENIDRGFDGPITRLILQHSSLGSSKRHLKIKGRFPEVGMCWTGVLVGQEVVYS